MWARFIGERETDILCNVDVWHLTPGDIHRLDVFTHGGHGPMRVIVDGCAVVYYPDDFEFHQHWEEIDE